MNAFGDKMMGTAMSAKPTPAHSDTERSAVRDHVYFTSHNRGLNIWTSRTHNGALGIGTNPHLDTE